MLEHEEKQLIRKVITGFTYHEKYKLYKSLAGDLSEKDALVALLTEQSKRRMKTPSKAVVKSSKVQEG